MTRYILNILYLSILAILSPWIVWRGVKKRSLLLRWKERWLGLVDKDFLVDRHLDSIKADHRESIWLHAVSVGEVNLLGPIIRELTRMYPECRLVISSTTASGLELARKQFAKHQVFRCPLDFTWAHRNVLKRLNIRLIVLSELEIWPNLLQLAKEHSVPTVVINGRLSEKSYRGYVRLKPLLKQYFGILSFVGAQNETYAQRFIRLGCRNENVQITGNIKFDNCELDPWTQSSQRLRQRLGLERNTMQLGTYRHQSSMTGMPTPIFVAGSTQEGEEQIVLDAYVSLLKLHPQLRLVLVPRHPERADDTAQSIGALQLNFVRLSSLPSFDALMADAGRSLNTSWQVLLGDTVGDLKWLWSLADVAFVGGSFSDRGGQNMIEPLGYGAAVCVGPNTINFAQVVKTLKDEGCLTQLDSPRDLEPWVSHQLQDHDQRHAAGKWSQEVISKQRGALQKTMHGLGQLYRRQVFSSITQNAA